jgi:2,4-dienoyl-CoA reductase-like NADH-dependent reductase (Old Yellow Enzyme family)
LSRIHEFLKINTMSHSRLFEPLPLRCGLVLSNRSTVAPMTTWSSHQDGTIHPDELAYLRRRSKGPALVMTAACYVQPEGHAFDGQWGCHDDAMLPSLRSAAEAIHSEGALAVLQIHHGGRMCPASLLGGNAPLSAGAVPAERPGADIPRTMMEDEIFDCIDAFADATSRAIAAGYDGVEIHGANTYLLQQFFSPHSNRRDDDWGGTLEKRLRFPLAVADAVLEAAGESTRPFAVGYRLSPEEIEEPGITLEDTMLLVDELARLRSGERALDWLHISVRDYRAGSLRNPQDTARPTRAVIDRLARLPEADQPAVIGVGMLYSPEDARFTLDDGCAAFALGRIALMEPEWTEKVRTGRDDEIRKTLPARGGDATLTIPQPMYRLLVSRKGWLRKNG